jgi:hypothetical protein
MNKKIVIGIVAAIIILAGIFLYTRKHQVVAPETNSNTTVTDNTNTPPSPGDVPTDSPDTNPTIPTSDTIAVSTQIPGNSVTIDNVFLSKPGFVTIHETTAKGQPGAVIGTSGLLGTGAKQDLELTANLKPGAKYIAMIRTDNGDKKFNADQDPAVMKDNLPVMILFSVSQ